MKNFTGLTRLRTSMGLALLALTSLLLSSSTALPAAPRVLWSVPMQGWAGASPVLGPGNTVLLVDARGIAMLVNTRSGQPSWSYDLGDRLLYTPAVSGDTLLIARVGELAVLGPQGHPHWIKATGVAPVLSPAIARDGTVYAADGPLLYAMRSDGKERWQYKTATFYSGSPVIAHDGTVYIGAKTVLMALDPKGRQKWFHRADSTLYSNPAIDAAGNLYLGTGHGIVSLDAAGRVRWKYAGAATEATPVIGADNRIYAGDVTGRFTALSPSGQVVWTRRLGQSIGASAALARGSIYVGTGDGRLHALDLAGHEQWAVQLGGAVFGAPMIGPDGHVYVGAGRSYFALNTASPLAAAPWPLARQNPFAQGRAP